MITKNIKFRAFIHFLFLGLGLLLPACQIAGPNCNNDYANLTFAQIDSNKDENMSLEEYQNLFKKAGANGIDQNALKNTFTGYDSNSDQRVSRSEFNAIADKNTQKLGLTFGGCASKDLSNQF